MWVSSSGSAHSNLHVGEGEGLFELLPLEGQRQRLAHRAVRAVAPDDPREPRPLVGLPVARQGHGDPIVVLLERADLHRALHVSAEAPEVLGEDALGVGLRDAEHEGVRRVVVLEADVRDARPLGVEVRAVERAPGFHEAARDAHDLGNLQGARLDGEGLRLVGRLRRLVDDARSNAVAKELCGHGEPGRAGADDEDLGSSGRGRRHARDDAPALDPFLGTLRSPPLIDELDVDLLRRGLARGLGDARGRPLDADVRKRLLEESKGDDAGVVDLEVDLLRLRLREVGEEKVGVSLGHVETLGYLARRDHAPAMPGQREDGALSRALLRRGAARLQRLAAPEEHDAEDERHHQDGEAHEERRRVSEEERREDPHGQGERDAAAQDDPTEDAGDGAADARGLPGEVQGAMDERRANAAARRAHGEEPSVENGRRPPTVGTDGIHLVPKRKRLEHSGMSHTPLRACATLISAGSLRPCGLYVHDCSGLGQHLLSGFRSIKLKEERMRIAGGVLMVLMSLVMGFIGLAVLTAASGASYLSDSGALAFFEIHGIVSMLAALLGLAGGVLSFVNKAKALVMIGAILMVFMPLSLLVVSIVLGGRHAGPGMVLLIGYLIFGAISGVLGVFGAAQIGKPPTASQMAMIGAPGQPGMYGAPPGSPYGPPGGPPPGGGPGYGPPGGGYGGPPGGGYGGPPGGGYGGPPGGGGGGYGPPGGGGYGPPR